MRVILSRDKQIIVSHSKEFIWAFCWGQIWSKLIKLIEYEFSWQAHGAVSGNCVCSKNLILRIQKYSPNIFPWLPHQPCTAVLHLPVSFLWPFCQLYVLPFCQWSCNCLLFFYRKCILAACCDCTSVQSCFPLWGDVAQIRHHSSFFSWISFFFSSLFHPKQKAGGR